MGNYDIDTVRVGAYSSLVVVIDNFRAWSGHKDKWKLKDNNGDKEKTFYKMFLQVITTTL